MKSATILPIALVMLSHGKAEDNQGMVMATSRVGSYLTSLIQGNTYYLQGPGASSKGGLKFIPGGKGKGVHICYEEVMKTPDCAKDFFSYAERNDKKCSCNKLAQDTNNMQIKSNAAIDYYKIQPVGAPIPVPVPTPAPSAPKPKRAPFPTRDSAKYADWTPLLPYKAKDMQFMTDCPYNTSFDPTWHGGKDAGCWVFAGKLRSTALWEKGQTTCDQHGDKCIGFRPEEYCTKDNGVTGCGRRCLEYSTRVHLIGAVQYLRQGAMVLRKPFQSSDGFSWKKMPALEKDGQKKKRCKGSCRASHITFCSDNTCHSDVTGDAMCKWYSEITNNPSPFKGCPWTPKPAWWP